MKRAIILFITLLSFFQTSCNKTKKVNEEFPVYNMQVDAICSENSDAIFYIPSRNEIQIIAQYKNTKDKQNAIRNPLKGLSDTGNYFYIYDNNLYYIKKEQDYTQAGVLPNKTSIVEIDWDTYNEKIIYDEDTSLVKDSFLGVMRTEKEKAAYSSIMSFFLDDENIYLIENTMTGCAVKIVSRKNGRSETIIESAGSISQLAFDGKHIYYVDARFQVIRIDVNTKESFLIPDVMTRSIMLSKNQLLFLNPRDNNRIYAMDLDDFSQRKITDDAAYAFHFDNDYIYYSNEYDNNCLYKIDWKGENKQKVADMVTYGIKAFQDYPELHVLSEEGTYVVNKKTFEVNKLD